MANSTIRAQPRTIMFNLSFTGSGSFPNLSTGYAEFYFSNATNINDLKAKMVDGVSYITLPGSPVSLGASSRVAVMCKTDATFTKTNIGNSFVRASSLLSNAISYSNPSFYVLLIPA